MRHPEFESFIKEGFDDVDVIFKNATGKWTWHYQLKDHLVNVTEFREVLERFSKLSQDTNLKPRRFILGCIGLAPSLVSLWRIVKEYRETKLIYSTKILGSTLIDLNEKVDKLNLSNWADLIVELLEIDVVDNTLSDTEMTFHMERFRAKFIGSPFYHQEDLGAVDRLFLQLAVRVNKGARVGFTREGITHLIEKEFASAVKGPAIVVYLHGWVRQNYEVEADIEVDWTDYFDRDTLRLPTAEIWTEKLLPELVNVRERLDDDGHRRNIWLRTRAPLSVGMMFGHVFAEAAGYSITIQQQSPGVDGGLQYWSTDSIQQEALHLDIVELEGVSSGKDVVIGIGITDDVKPRVDQFLARTSLKGCATLYLHPSDGPGPLTVNENNVGALAISIKQHMRRFADQQRARIIHLFYFGPLGLSVLLGQKLNGLPDIQCYERDKLEGYVSSCLLLG